MYKALQSLLAPWGRGYNNIPIRLARPHESSSPSPPPPPFRLGLKGFIIACYISTMFPKQDKNYITLRIF